VWQPSALVSWAWAGAGGVGGVDISEVDRAEQTAAQRLAEEGAALAVEAGLRARAETARAEGPIWDAIVAFAHERDVSAIVLGSRGLTGLKSVLLGSVSEGVTRHAHRTAVVVQDPSAVLARKAA
jgi:nucleotide-binding universal stress UspA family protein